MSRTRRLVAGVAMLMCIATPALADPAAPTTYRSEVTSVEPAVPGFSVEVAGGDAFLRISAEPDVSVLVPGYEGEPFVRIDAEGTVEANQNSPSYWINGDRFGIAPVPATATAEAAPDWIVVGSGGTYAWHDHRIHWMSPTPPPGVDESVTSVIQTWTLPIEVDSVTVEVSGVLAWVPPSSPLPWIGVIAVAVAAGMFLSPLISLGLAAVIALGFGAIQAATSALGIWSEWMSVVPPLIVCGVVLFLLIRRTASLVVLGTGLVLMGVWAFLRVGYFNNPVLPVPIDPNIARAILAVAVGLTVAAILRTYRERMSPS